MRILLVEDDAQLASLFLRRQIHKGSKAVLTDSAIRQRVTQCHDGVDDLRVETHKAKDLTDPCT